MSNEFKAGYQKAIDDLCKMHDKVHKRYHELWKSGNANNDAGYRLEIEVVTLHGAICELEANKRAITNLDVLE